MFTFKKASCAAYWDLGTSLLLYCHLCLYLLFCFANLRYQGDIPYLTRKKSWRRLYIFLKPRSMKVRYFKLTCWYASFLIVNSVLFQFGSYARGASLHLSENELKVMLVFRPQTCVLIYLFTEFHYV